MHKHTDTRVLTWAEVEAPLSGTTRCGETWLLAALMSVTFGWDMQAAQTEGTGGLSAPLSKVWQGLHNQA